MKEDLIVIPDLDAFRSLIEDAKSDLSEMEADVEDSSDRRDLALDVINILDAKLKAVKSLTTIDFNEKIWFAAHLYLLETILEDLFDDDMFFEDEEEEEEEEEELELDEEEKN